MDCNLSLDCNLSRTMIVRVSLLVAALVTSVCSVGEAFVTHQAVVRALGRESSSTRGCGVFSAASSTRNVASPRSPAQHWRLQQRMSQSISIEDLCLTPQLERMTKAFRAAPNDKLRHVQLLEMAGMAPPLDPSMKTKDNEVPG